MSDRIYETNMIVGAKGEGKSPFLIKKVLNEAYDLRSQKILVVTPTITKSWAPYTPLASVQPLFKRKWHGIFTYHSDDDDQMLLDISNLIRQKKMVNGLIVLEDCSGYLKPNLQFDVRKALGNHKNCDVDLIGTTHALAFVPKFMRMMISSITIFKTNEVFKSAEEIRQLDFPNYAHIFDAWQWVMKQPRVNGWIQPNVTIKTGV